MSSKRKGCVGEVLGKAKQRDVIDCKVCGHAHFSPVPSPQELKQFYENVYSESTPSPNYADKFETINGLFSGKKKKRILEIGSWDGEQLQFFKDAGWECLGVEPNGKKSAIAMARGIKVIRKMFQEVKDDELGTFDAVNLSFVLEHVDDPGVFLCRISEKLMNIGGIICIEVPNDFNALQKAAKANSGLRDYWVCEPDHINYFGISSLKQLLKKHGFETVLAEASFPMELFLLFGENYVKDPIVGKACHQKRLSFEKALKDTDQNGLKRELYQKMAEIGIGRSIIVFAKKIKQFNQGA